MAEPPTATTITQALICELSGCLCQKTAHEGKGLTHCPAHGDGRPSLHIDVKDGKPLFRCFAGCTQDAIIDELKRRDLWPKPPERTPQRTTDYPYRLADGTIVATHRRIDRGGKDKLFYWLLPDGTISKGGQVKPAQLPLYRLPEIVHEDRVILCEGEKAVDACWLNGLVATTLAPSAGQTEYGEALEALRSKDVWLWPDFDKPGYNHMTRVARELAERAVTVRWLWIPSPSPAGMDAWDYFAQGRSTDALRDYLHQDPPPPAPEWTRQGDTGESMAEAEGLPVKVAHMRTMAQVTAARLKWLWPGRIPMGKLTIIDGDPGLGKSLVTIDIGARLTRGDPMPNESLGTLGRQPTGVVYLAMEDDPEDTIRPRFDVAGADPERVVLLEAITDEKNERGVTIADIWAIEEAIRRVDARLVVIDPLMGYLPSDTKSFIDQEIRAALSPLVRMAARLKVAVVGVRHLNKSGGKNPLYRGGGSIGLIGAARAALMVLADPDDVNGHRRFLAPTKSNLGPTVVGLAYHIEAFYHDGVSEMMPRIQWEGFSTQTAERLLEDEDDIERRSELQEATDFLELELAKGPVASKDLQRSAKDIGISIATLRRACRKLNTIATQEGRTWYTALPEAREQPGDVCVVCGRDLFCYGNDGRCYCERHDPRIEK
jgi:archaellum biogenesis ATPase FlaH